MSIQLWNGRDWGSLSHWNTVSISNIASWNGVEAISIPILYLQETKNISPGSQSYGGIYVTFDEYRLWIVGIFVREVGAGVMSKSASLYNLTITDEPFTANNYDDMRAVTWFDSGYQFLIASENSSDGNFYLVPQGTTTPFSIYDRSGVTSTFQVTYRVLGGIIVSNDGSKAAIMEQISTETIVKFYTLSTPNSINTASLDGSINLGMIAYGCFDSDGSFYYIDTNESPPMIYYVRLATPWDYTTAQTARAYGSINAATYDYKGIYIVHKPSYDNVYINDGVYGSQQILRYSTIPDVFIGLAAYYSFDLNSEDDLYANHGTDSGITYLTGFKSYAAYFDASTDNINVGNSLVANQTNFSFSFWAYHSGDPTHDEDYFSRGPNGHAADAYMLLWRDYDPAAYTLRIVINGTSTLISSTEISSGEWIHIVLSFSGTGADNQIRLFINGVEDSNSPWVPSSTTGGVADQALIFGNDKNLGGSYALEGYLDEIAVYNRALGDPEVSWLYNQGNARIYDDIEDLIYREKFTLVNGSQPSNYDWQKTNNSGGDVSDIDSQAFRFTSTVAATNTATTLTSRYALSGDFDIRWKYTIHSWSIPSTSISFAIRFNFKTIDGTDEGFFAVAYPSGGSQSYIWGTSEASYTSTTTDFTLDGMMRITRVGGSIRLYIWNGTTWTLSGSTFGQGFPTSIIDAIVPEFYFRADIDSNVDISFDDFRVYKGGWELSQRVYLIGSITKSISGDQYQGLDIRPDGSQIYCVENYDDRVEWYNMSTYFDITTAGALNGYTLGEEKFDDLRGFCWSDNGNRFFASTCTDSTIPNCHLTGSIVTTPYNISTYTGIDSYLDVPFFCLSGIKLNSDGTKLVYIFYDTAGSEGEITVYNLSTPWDLSTATLGTVIEGVDRGNFTENGDCYYILNETTHFSVNRITLTTPWDFTTANAPEYLGQIPNPIGLYRGVTVHEEENEVLIYFCDCPVGTAYFSCYRYVK